jgi:hypothetical protein
VSPRRNSVSVARNSWRSMLVPFAIIATNFEKVDDYEV